MGPVWAQKTKPDAADPCGPEALAQMVAASPWPCVAIGGVDAGRLAMVRATGAAGAAVVSAICGRDDVEAATRLLVRSWRGTRAIA
ncbi:thiamine phosphate synthase [Frondihabitans sucicola]|uniref:thiamine phosphate synthase n=1 Tax=Frondihabitans sucicola TaxID=1268041 RepID=UPI002573F913|nr:thiamine phosphate synthase [Frondihabitans sucicola]